MCVCVGGDHRMNTRSSIFTSGGATSENITFGVHE